LLNRECSGKERQFAKRFPQEKKLEHFSKQNPSLDPRKRRKELTQKSKRRRKNMPRAAKEKAVF